jgi:hypothetical protein
MKFKISTSQVQQIIDVVQDDPYKFVFKVISLLTTLEKDDRAQETQESNSSQELGFYITQEQVNLVRTYLQEKPFKIVFNCINLLSTLESVPDQSQVSSS